MYYQLVVRSQDRVHSAAWQMRYFVLENTMLSVYKHALLIPHESTSALRYQLFDCQNIQRVEKMVHQTPDNSFRIFFTGEHYDELRLVTPTDAEEKMWFFHFQQLQERSKEFLFPSSPFPPFPPPPQQQRQRRGRRHEEKDVGLFTNESKEHVAEVYVDFLGDQIERCIIRSGDLNHWNGSTWETQVMRRMGRRMVPCICYGRKTGDERLMCCVGRRCLG